MCELCTFFQIWSHIVSLTSLKVTYKCCFHIRFQLLLFKSLGAVEVISFIIMRPSVSKFETMQPETSIPLQFFLMSCQTIFRITVYSQLADLANKEDTESLILPSLSTHAQQLLISIKCAISTIDSMHRHYSHALHSQLASYL